MQVTPDHTVTLSNFMFEYAPKMMLFRFVGPGLYINDTHTVLIVPMTKDPRMLWSDDQGLQDYWCHIYNCPLNQTIFPWVFDVPIRLDEGS